MATTINNIKVDFGLGATPPRVTFLQGADMSVINIRDTLREIEESEEGRMAPGAQANNGTSVGWICRAGGNFEFTDAESSALTVEIAKPFKMSFEAGAIPFQSSLGSLLGDFNESPGAIVQINNAIGASNLNSEDIEYASFAGGVWVDTANGTTGTVFPVGTERSPVNNFTDALTVANVRGFNTFYIIGDTTIDTGLDYTDFVFTGQGKNLSTFTVTSAANVTNCSFLNALVTGTLDGDSRIEDAIIENLDFVSGVIERCLLNPGTITLGGSETAHLIDCASGVPGVSTPTIDLGGSGQPLALRNYNGGVQLTNKTGADDVSVDLNSGQIILASSYAGTGITVLRGVGKVTDNSTGGTVVDELINTPAITEDVWAYTGP